MELYKKNKAYILDDEAIKIVKDIERIIKSREPYFQISKLNNLTDNFIDKFTEILETECKPVKEKIQEDSKVVLNEIEIYPFKDKLYSVFKTGFEEMINRIDKVNSIPEAIAMKEESERLKIRAFKEIELEKKKLKEKETSSKPKPMNAGEGTITYKTKETKTIRLSKFIGGYRTIENDRDLEELLDEIRLDLKKQLHDDKIIRLI